MDFEVTIVEEDGVTVAKVSGELDFATASTFRRALEQILPGDAVKIALDMDEVTFIDSEGIKTLLWLDVEMRQRKGSIRIRKCSRVVQRTFEVLGLERYLEFCVQSK